MAYKEGRSTIQQLSKFLKNFVLALRIQRTRRFVKNDNLRISEKCPRQGNFLPFADTKFFAILKPLSQAGLITSGQPSYQLMSTGMAGSCRDLLMLGWKVDIAQPYVLTSG